MDYFFLCFASKEKSSKKESGFHRFVLFEGNVFVESFLFAIEYSVTHILSLEKTISSYNSALLDTKKMKKIIFLASTLFVINSKLKAQVRVPKENINQPIQADIFATDKSINFLNIMDGYFSSKSKFAYLNANYFVGDYNNKAAKNEYESIAFVKYRLNRTCININSFFPVAGIMMSYYYGFRPTVGIEYIFYSPVLQAVVLPHFDLTETHNFETICLIKYLPKFNENWGLYASLQGLYNYNILNNAVDRQYVQNYIGIAYKQYAFGLGIKNDWLGASKIYQNQVGVFLRAEIF